MQNINIKCTKRQKGMDNFGGGDVCMCIWNGIS